jgi:hypothetical protein
MLEAECDSLKVGNVRHHERYDTHIYADTLKKSENGVIKNQSRSCVSECPGIFPEQGKLCPV